MGWGAWGGWLWWGGEGRSGSQQGGPITAQQPAVLNQQGECLGGLMGEGLCSLRDKV